MLLYGEQTNINYLFKLHKTIFSLAATRTQADEQKHCILRASLVAQW